jgi:hypothetical protein
MSTEAERAPRSAVFQLDARRAVTREIPKSLLGLLILISPHASGEREPQARSESVRARGPRQLSSMWGTGELSRREKAAV